MPANNAAQIQLGVLDLLAQSGPVAKSVLLMLFGSSVLCWTIILLKRGAVLRAKAQNKQFLAAFWNGKNIEDVFVKSDGFPASPVALVFKAGVKELKKLPSARSEGGVDNIHRALLRAGTHEISRMERHVSWLATIASAAPFVGLFGTVWGIMNSFQGIGATGSANLAVVAPGISEALITTAAGIFAAIPAVAAYNYFVGQIKRMSVEIECFCQDFLNIIQRSVMSDGKGV